MGKKSNEIIVLLLGETGSGKSSFVNLASGKTPARVGNNMVACTAECQVYPLVQHYRNSTTTFLLVDTPGFNQTNKLDSAIKKEIADFLHEKYSDDTRFGAALYFASLAEPRGAGVEKFVPTWPVPVPGHQIIVIGAEGHDVSPELAQKRRKIVERALSNLQQKETSSTSSSDAHTWDVLKFDFTQETAQMVLDNVRRKGAIDLRSAKQALWGGWKAQAKSAPKKSKGLAGWWKRLFGLG